MFRTLGLRHMVVINENFEVEGLLTRECFMDHYVDKKKKNRKYDPSLEDTSFYTVEDPTETELDMHVAMMPSNTTNGSALTDSTPLLSQLEDYGPVNRGPSSGTA